MMREAFLLSACLLLLLGGFFLGFSGSVDDAHITYGAAASFARYGEILNYNLDRVEQSSSLLLVVMLGSLKKITGLSVVTLGHLTTIVMAVVTLFFFCRLLRGLSVASSGAVLLASSPFFVYWAFGGMEGPWLSLLLVLLMLHLPQCLSVGGISPGVAFLSLAIQIARPETPIVLCVFALSLFAAKSVFQLHQWSWRALLRFLCMQCTVAVLLAMWRWWYFGDIFPQPVSVKASGVSLAHWTQGIQYAAQTWGNVWLWLFSVSAVLGVAHVIFVDKRIQPILAVLLVVIYSGFVVSSGGDWMAAGRFWVPVLPLLCLLVALALERLVQKPLLYGVMLALLVAANGIYLWRGTTIDFNGIPLWKKTVLTAEDHPERFSFFERHARENLHDIPVTTYVETLLGKIIALRAMQGDVNPVVLMAGQMGMVPFYLSELYAGKIRFIDRNGITERTLSDCLPAAGLLRTRNGIGTGYEWVLDNRAALEKECNFVMPDVVFDIETGWNRRNIMALERAGYVFVYRQRGHVFDEPEDALLPLRKIGAGEFLAVSHSLWQQLGSPAPVMRVF